MLRLFVGLSIPNTICRRLMLMQGGIQGASWAEASDHHLTLSFIGDTDEAAAEDVHDILSRLSLPRLSLCLHGVNVFEDGDKLRVLWAGIKPSDDLMQLQSKIAAALMQGRIDIDARKFTPHVTLARLKNPDRVKLADFIGAYAAFETEIFAVDAFHLYDSRRVDSGPRYDVIASYALS